jgi:Holliday junction resolvase RusA-like endonuclease
MSLRGGYLYTPKRTRHAVSMAKVYAKNALRAAGVVRVTRFPVKVTVLARYVPSTSMSKKAAQYAIRNRYRPLMPDVDNIAKLAMDALTGIAIHDDRQVVELTVTKVYDFKPGLDVKIEVVRMQ